MTRRFLVDRLQIRIAVVLVFGEESAVKLRRSASVWLIAGALLTCLACTELPELLTLTDNATNDFTVFFRSCDNDSSVVEVLNRTASGAVVEADRGIAHRDFAGGAMPTADLRVNLQALNSQWRL